MQIAANRLLQTSAATLPVSHITMPSTHINFGLASVDCKESAVSSEAISAAPITHGIRHVRVSIGTNPYKLVACDMDGTLLCSNHTVTEYTRRVLSQLLAKGVHIIFATGRPFTDVNRIKRRLNIFASKEKIPTPGVQVITPSAHSPSSEYPCADRQQNSMSQSSLSVLHNSEYLPTVHVVPRCFAITSNGACIYDEGNSRIFERCIEPKLCKTLYNMFMEDPEVNINVFRGVVEADRLRSGYRNPSDIGDDHAKEEWVSRYPSDLEAALYHQSGFTFTTIKDLETTFPTDHVNEIFFLCYNLQKATRVEELIMERIEKTRQELAITESVRVAPSAPYCLDIIPGDVSKATALEYVVQQLGITMLDCIAFGDGMNDVEMLNAVGKGCIMENGCNRLKMKLSHLEVVGRNDEDGVARKLAEVFDLK